MATKARSAIGGLLLGSVSEGLLSHADGPFLLIGPHASLDAVPALTPVAAIEDDSPSNAIRAALAAWTASFDGPPPQLADVGDRGHAADALTELADQVDNAVIVVASTRWTDPDRMHLRSVARRLARDAHHPVLVVPAQRVPAAAR
jgi:nucleotide-binding universal stress UspA family protein